MLDAGVGERPQLVHAVMRFKEVGELSSSIRVARMDIGTQDREGVVDLSLPGKQIGTVKDR
jgi:hypothetical protein